MSGQPTCTNFGFTEITPCPSGAGPSGSQSPLSVSLGAVSARTSRGVSGAPVALGSPEEPGTTIVELTATQPCFFAFGDENVTAGASDCYLSANLPRRYGIDPGQYIAAVQAGSGGTLYITQGA